MLVRAGIVVDNTENPEAYQAVLDDIDERLAKEKESARSTANIVQAVQSSVDEYMPYRVLGYAGMLKAEAEARGLERLTQYDQVGLSRFITVGGICHQHALLSATMLRLLQDRGDIGGTVSLASSSQSDELNLDRHTLTVLYEGDDMFQVDLLLGDQLDPNSLPFGIVEWED